MNTKIEPGSHGGIATKLMSISRMIAPRIGTGEMREMDMWKMQQLTVAEEKKT